MRIVGCIHRMMIAGGIIVLLFQYPLPMTIILAALLLTERA